jgi:hypothetical protein
LKRFSEDAIQFGTRRGMKLVSWDYPAKESLKETIDQLGLYPTTCLTSLTQLEKRSLLDYKIVLCSELCQDTRLLENLGLKPSRVKAVIGEGMQLCKWIIHQENMNAYESATCHTLSGSYRATQQR